MPPAPEELSPQRIAALTMRFQGQSLDQIAKHFGVSRQAVEQWEDAPLWRAEWKLRRDDLLKRTRQLARQGALVGIATLTELAQGIGTVELDKHGNPAKLPNGSTKRERVSNKERIAAATALLRFAQVEGEDDDRPVGGDDLTNRVAAALAKALNA